MSNNIAFVSNALEQTTGLGSLPNIVILIVLSMFIVVVHTLTVTRNMGIAKCYFYMLFLFVLLVIFSQQPSDVDSSNAELILSALSQPSGSEPEEDNSSIEADD